jgi:hypothetical protein
MFGTQSTLPAVRLPTTVTVATPVVTPFPNFTSITGVNLLGDSKNLHLKLQTVLNNLSVQIANSV